MSDGFCEKAPDLARVADQHVTVARDHRLEVDIDSVPFDHVTNLLQMGEPFARNTRR